MKVTVIHSSFLEPGEAPVTVAEVDANTNDVDAALEYAYRWTNNVMGSWSRKEEYFDNGEQNGDYNEDVTVLAPLHEGGMGLRSTSMGDQMIVDGKTYEVAAFGFKEKTVDNSAVVS